MPFATRFGLQPIFGGGANDYADDDAMSSSSNDGNSQDDTSTGDAPSKKQSPKSAGDNSSKGNGGLGLMIAIMALVPLFIIKTSDAVIPNLDCTKASNAQVDMCVADQKKRGEAQYILKLVLSFLGLIVAFALTRYRSTGHAAVLGLAYGSMLGLLYAVATNLDKFNSPLQMLIIGVVLVSLIFLPRVTDAGLMLEAPKKNKKTENTNLAQLETRDNNNADE